MLKNRILIVDDNAGVRTLVRRLFEVERDFEIVGEAENGREAVEKASILKPALIILDLSMPVMSGLDAASWFKNHLPETRLILFTVEEGREVELLARSAGIHAFVLKHKAAASLVLQARALLPATNQDQDPAKFRNAS
jgi:DNA-binding NarL/FixJ family response regulator